MYNHDKKEGVSVSSRKLLLSSIIIILTISAGAFLFYPMKFERYLSEREDLLISHYAGSIDPSDGTPSSESKDYFLEHETSDAEELVQIMSRYSFHRGLSYFGDESSIEGYGGHMISIAAGDHTINLAGNREILIDGKVNKMGFLKNKKALSLIEDIIKILENMTEYEMEVEP